MLAVAAAAATATIKIPDALNNITLCKNKTMKELPALDSILMQAAFLTWNSPRTFRSCALSSSGMIDLGEMLKLAV